MSMVYMYCSYEGGKPYKLGTILTKKQTQLRTDKIDPFFQKAFQTKNLVKACGLDPDHADQFFIMSPRLEAPAAQGSNGPNRFYIQFAIVTKGRDNFLQIMKGGYSKDQIAAAFRDIMVVGNHKDQNFGYDLDPTKFNPIFDLGYGVLFEGVKPHEATQQTCICLDGNMGGKELETLGQSLGFQENKHLTKLPDAPGWFAYVSDEAATNNKRFALLTRKIKVNNVLHGRVVA